MGCNFLSASLKSLHCSCRGAPVDASVSRKITAPLALLQGFWESQWPQWPPSMPFQSPPLTICSSSLSYRPVVLAWHQADRDRVRQPPVAALLPDPIQRCQRRGLPGPGRPLGHHQLQNLQIRPTGRAEDGRGPPLQVSGFVLVPRCRFCDGWNSLLAHKAGSNNIFTASQKL